MKDSMTIIFTYSHFPCKLAILLSTLCVSVLSACGHSPTSMPATSTLIPIPTIVPSRVCELAPGGIIPLAVMGVPGTEVKYAWNASAGIITPPDGPAVIYTAPASAQDVIIRVTVHIGSGTSDGMLTCKVVATPTPLPTFTATLLPTDTPSPTPGYTITPPLCEGSTSQALIAKAWVVEPQTRLACAQLVIDRYTQDAMIQQDAKRKIGCSYTPYPSNKSAVTDFYSVYWALNDVGTAWFLKGLALDDLGNRDDAQKAYKTARDIYPCAYAMSKDQSLFYSVMAAAEEKIKQ